LPLVFKLHEICSVHSQKIIKILTTRCQILRLKCTKFDFGWGSAADHAGELTALPQTPLAGFEGPTSKGGEEGKGEGVRGEGREENGGERRPFCMAKEAFCLKSAPG